MEGDGQDIIAISKTYDGMAVTVLPNRCSRIEIRRQSDNAKNYSEFTSSNVATNTSYSAENNGFSSDKISYVTNMSHLINIKPTSQHRGCIIEMSKDSNYFAQTLRKYPLAKTQTKSSDLIQEILKYRVKNANRKPQLSKRLLRKTTSQQAFRTNHLIVPNTNDFKRLRKIEERSHSYISDIEYNSVNEDLNYMYDYLNKISNLNATEVRYFTGIKKICSRLNNAICPRPQICTNLQNRWNYHQEKYHDDETNQKTMKKCNPSTCFGLRPLQFRCKKATRSNEIEKDHNCPKFNNNVINLQRVIKKWTYSIITKKNSDDTTQMQLVNKLAKFLSNLSTKKNFLLEAKNEIIKYLKALSRIHPHIINDNLDQLAENLLDNLTNENNIYQEEIATSTNDLPLKSVDVNNAKKSLDDYIKNTLSPVQFNNLKLYTIDFINQLPLEWNDGKYETLNKVVEKFLNNLLKLYQSEDNIKNNSKDVEISDHYETNKYLPIVLEWFKGIPELSVHIHDNMKYLETLANKLSEIFRSDNFKDNQETAKREILKWIHNILILNDVSYTKSIQENLTNKLVSKFESPSEKIYDKRYPKENPIYNEIYLWFENTDKELKTHMDVEKLINSLLSQLNDIIDKSNGNTLHIQFRKELESWFDYLAKSFDIHFNDEEKKNLEYKTLPRIKALLKQKNRWYQQKSLQLKKIVLDEITNSFVSKDINITQVELQNIFDEIESQIFDVVPNNKLPDIKIIFEKLNTILHSKLKIPTNKIDTLAKKILDRINEASTYLLKESAIQTSIQDEQNIPMDKQIELENILNSKNQINEKTTKLKTDRNNCDSLQNWWEFQKTDKTNLGGKAFLANIDLNSDQRNELIHIDASSDHIIASTARQSTDKRFFDTGIKSPIHVDDGDIRKNQINEKTTKLKTDRNNCDSLHNWWEFKNTDKTNLGDKALANIDLNSDQRNVLIHIDASSDHIITSTARQSTDKRFFDTGIKSPIHVDDGDTRKDSMGVNNKKIYLNQLKSKIKEWLEIFHFKLNKDDEKIIITSIASDIIHRDNYVRVSSKSVSDLEEIEYLKYLIFKVLSDFIEHQKMDDILCRVSKLHETIEKTVRPKHSDTKIENELVSEKNTIKNVISSFLKWINVIPLDHSKLIDIKCYEYLTQELIKNIQNFKIDRNSDELRKSFINEINRVFLQHFMNTNTDSGIINKDNTVGRPTGNVNNVCKGTCNPFTNIKKFAEVLINIVLRYVSLKKNSSIQCYLQNDILQLLQIVPTVTKQQVNKFINEQMPDLVTMISNSIEKSLKIQTPSKKIEDSDSLLYRIINNWCKSLPIYDKDITKTKTYNTKNLTFKLFEKIRQLNQNYSIFDSKGFNKNVLNDELDSILHDIPMSLESKEDLLYYKNILISQLKDNNQDIQEEIKFLVYKQNLIHTISKTLPNIEFSSNDNLESFEALKNNLANAFINLNSHNADEKFKDIYKEKLKIEINKFCSVYFERFPSTPLDTKQLRSNIYNALQNVPKPPQSKSEMEIATAINNWLDELCKEINDFTRIEIGDMILGLTSRLYNLNKEYKLSYLNTYDELRNTIFKWLQDYSLKQDTPLNSQYWMDKLLNSLKTLCQFGKSHSSITTSVSMFTVPADETTLANKSKYNKDKQKENSEQRNGNNSTVTSSILVSDIITAEERDLLARIRDRSSKPLMGSKNTEHTIPKFSQKNYGHAERFEQQSQKVKNQSVEKPERKPEEISPKVSVQEYFWESNASTQTSQTDTSENLSNKSILEHTSRMKRNIPFKPHKNKTLETESFPNYTIPKLNDAIIQTDREAKNFEHSNDLSNDLLYDKPEPNQGMLSKNRMPEHFSNYSRSSQTSQIILPRNSNVSALKVVEPVQEHFKEVSSNRKNTKEKYTKISDKTKYTEIIDQNKQIEEENFLQENENTIITNCTSYENVSNETIKSIEIQRNQNEINNEWQNDVPNPCKTLPPKCITKRHCRFAKRFTLKSENAKQNVANKTCDCGDSMFTKCRIRPPSKKSQHSKLNNCAQCFGAHCPFPSCLYFNTDF